jgi:hypothetical protein
MKKKNYSWFTSILIVLLLTFFCAVILGIYMYGLQRVIDESLFYLIGATFTGIIIYIVVYIFKRKRWKLL